MRASPPHNHFLRRLGIAGAMDTAEASLGCVVARSRRAIKQRQSCTVPYVMHLQMNHIMHYYQHLLAPTVGAYLYCIPYQIQVSDHFQFSHTNHVSQLNESLCQVLQSAQSRLWMDLQPNASPVSCYWPRSTF